MRNSFVRAIGDVMDKNDKVVLLIGDIGAYLVRDVVTRHPKRVFNMGITEGAMMSVAAGVALDGWIPFVYTITPFVTARCYDQIRVGVAYHNANVKIVGVGSGISYSSLGSTHHSLEDIAALRSLPNMTIISPADGKETLEATQAAAEHVGPVYLRLGLKESPVEGLRETSFEIGKVRVLRKGQAAAIIATGDCVSQAMQTAETLAGEGLEISVINASTIKPLDVLGITRAIREIPFVFTLEEHNIYGGLGSAVADVVSGMPGDRRPVLRRFGIRDSFIKKYGTKPELYALLSIDVASVAKEIKREVTFGQQDGGLTIIRKDIERVITEVGNEVSKLANATLLITGSSGLLASYIVDTIAHLNDTILAGSPCKVWAFQRSEVGPNDRLGHLVGRNDIKFTIHDASKPYEIKERVDYIIHAAGRSAPASFQADALGTIGVNVDGMRWLLDYAKDHAVKSVLYMSSGEIYGNPTPENIPTPETYAGNASPLSPRACYTQSKRLAETLCRIYFSEYRVPVKIARPFIVYGPGLALNDKRVMADFMRSGIKGEPIQMLSDGLDTRTYCYISDATALFMKILLSDYNGEVFNIANNKEEVSIRRLAELVHEICGITQPVSVQADPDNKRVKGAPSRVFPDLQKVEKMFGYTPKIGIREGLARTISWNRLSLGA